MAIGPNLFLIQFLLTNRPALVCVAIAAPILAVVALAFRFPGRKPSPSNP